MFSIQIKATSRSAKRETVQELLVLVQALRACTRSLVYRHASVHYKLFIMSNTAEQGQQSKAGNGRGSSGRARECGRVAI